MKGAAPYLYASPERLDLTCYGTGDNTWGVQTNQKAFAAYAMLAAAPELDAARAGMSREELTETALRLLRFSLHSHHEGSYRCMDGTQWGHTWISALGIERMMHGVEAIERHLTEADRELLRKVLISESDWLLEHYGIVAGLYAKDGNNKPESNLWNGALLHRTAAMFPDSPNAERYREKGDRFLINSISVPGDAENAATADGKRISELFVGANFFESYALNHHGYLNVGYMVICLSNAAMLHFMYRAGGRTPPESLYHHVKELWEVVRSCIFPDGRLLRIGGDTRVRYAYCQEYLVPVWLMARDLYGDDGCAAMEAGWLAQVELEMDANGDGTFLSRRGSVLAEQSPLYFARLESDRAAALSMGAAWAGLAAAGAARTAATAAAAAGGERLELRSLSSWHDEHHGAYLHRSGSRIASWVWDAAEKPQGLCLPPEASDMAEWRENMAGRIAGLGKVSAQRLLAHGGACFDGGFVTWGGTVCHTEGLLAEGRNDEEIACSRIVCAALPDDTHMVVLQRMQAADRRIYAREAKGLHLLVPNDVFNRNRRLYYYEHGMHPVNGYGSQEETIPLRSRWLNVDDRLGVLAVYGTDGLQVHRPGRRQIGLKPSLRFEEREGSLYADEICGPVSLGLRSFDPNEIILDTGFVLQSGRDHRYTRQYASDGAAAAIDGLGERVRGVRVNGADGRTYALLANFGDDRIEASLAASRAAWDLTERRELRPEGGGTLRIPLRAGEGKLLRL